MSQYRAVCELSCESCNTSCLVDDPEITADAANDAVEIFKSRHRFCPACLDSGVVFAVFFATFLQLYPVLPCSPNPKSNLGTSSSQSQLQRRLRIRIGQ